MAGPVGGTTAAAYVVEQSANAGVAWVRICGTTDPLYAVTGLTAGTAYQFRVTATDAQGNPGAASPPLAVTTAGAGLGAAPVQPGPPVIGPLSEYAVTVYWAMLAPAPNGYLLPPRVGSRCLNDRAGADRCGTVPDHWP
jgi:hypothetical protein